MILHSDDKLDGDGQFSSVSEDIARDGDLELPIVSKYCYSLISIQCNTKQFQSLLYCAFLF